MIMSIITFLAIIAVLVLVLVVVRMRTKNVAMRNEYESQIADLEHELKLARKPAVEDVENPDIEELQEKIQQYESNLKVFVNCLRKRPMFTHLDDKDNDDEVINFIDAIVNTYPKNVSMTGFENFKKRQRAGRECYKKIEVLKRYMLEVQSSLQCQRTPLSEEQKIQNLATLLNMAMIAFDDITSYRTSNPDEGKNLNINILNGKMDRSEALKQAKQLTNLSIETYTWLRVIKETLENANIRPEHGVIISGYKL